MSRRMTSRKTRTNPAVLHPARSTEAKSVERRDSGVSLVEVLVGITLMSTVVVAVIAAVGMSIKVTAYERDHAKAQQWLQAAIGIIEAIDFEECDPAVINGTNVQQTYQAAVDVGRVDTNLDEVIDDNDGAQRPWQYEGVLSVDVPRVWDGEKFVDFDSQSVCYDQSRLRQQLVKMVVTHPSGVEESVEMIKVDR